MRRLLIPFLVILIGALTLWQRQAGTGLPGPPAPQPGTLTRPQARADLPAEARVTLALIDRGGPFPYLQDGTVFQNREGLLPVAAGAYYHEYTVRTPGAGDRGPRRIITGGTPPSVWYYTDDHYRHFRLITPVEKFAP